MKQSETQTYLYPKIKNIHSPITTTIIHYIDEVMDGREPRNSNIFYTPKTITIKHYIDVSNGWE
jgi:hypothetical protein